MKTDVISTKERTLEDRRQLDALAFAVYGPEEQQDDPSIRIAWAPTEISVVIRNEEDGDIVAHAGVLARDGLLNGDVVRIGGVGGVKTHPKVRGQHLGMTVVARAAELLREDFDVDFGLLVCEASLLSYYQQLGWTEFGGDLWITQPEGRVRFEFNKVMVMPGRRPAPADGVIDLQGYPW